MHRLLSLRPDLRRASRTVRLARAGPRRGDASSSGRVNLRREPVCELRRVCRHVSDRSAGGRVRAVLGPASAWTRTTCPSCGTGCEMAVGTRDGRIVSVKPVADAPVSRGTCASKGDMRFGFVSADDRITEPMIRSGLRVAACVLGGGGRVYRRPASPDHRPPWARQRRRAGICSRDE